VGCSGSATSGISRHSFKFNFFSDSRDRVTDLFDDPLKITRGKSQSPFPDSNLTRIRQINLIANWRIFGAAHGRSPGASAFRKKSLLKRNRLGDFSEPLNAHLVVHEQRQNDDDRKWDTNQPKQSASTKSHVGLHSTCPPHQPGKIPSVPLQGKSLKYLGRNIWDAFGTAFPLQHYLGGDGTEPHGSPN
jgi:hypothetical protein